jgi:hypothetical protein
LEERIGVISGLLYILIKALRQKVVCRVDKQSRPEKHVDQWRSQKLALGGENLLFYLKNSLYIALMYKKFKKVQLYLVLSGLSLGGANAPLHPPWLRY